MEAQELRLGNFVFDSRQNTEKVFELSIFGDLHRVNELSPEAFKPIPLTEELLLRFGFEKELKDFEISDEVFAFVKSQIYIHFIDRECWLCEEYDSNLSKIRKLKGVHDLQNLYFALTGEELTIKQLA